MNRRKLIPIGLLAVAAGVAAVQAPYRNWVSGARLTRRSKISGRE